MFLSLSDSLNDQTLDCRFDPEGAMAADAGDGPAQGPPQISRGEDLQTEQDQEQIVQTPHEETESQRKGKGTSRIAGEIVVSIGLFLILFYAILYCGVYSCPKM